MVGRDPEPDKPPRSRQPLEHVHLDGRVFALEERVGRVEPRRPGADDRDTKRRAHEGESRDSAAARSLVTAARTAAAHRGALRELLALLHLEGVAATAGRDRVRVVDLEAGLLEPVQKVDRRAAQVRGAERIDDDVHALELELVVAVGRAGVESEPVLETRATAALDRDAKD